MTSVADAVLYWLLWASLAASILLILFSTAVIGRKLADRDYQRAVGLNGTTRIQNSVNLRTHTMRVNVGLTFALIAVLLLADASMLWRQWVNRTLFVVLPLGYVVVSVFDWIAEREQQHIEIQNELAERARLTAASVSPLDSVDVATIQPEAVADIVDAVRSTPSAPEEGA